MWVAIRAGAVPHVSILRRGFDLHPVHGQMWATLRPVSQPLSHLLICVWRPLTPNPYNLRSTEVIPK